MNLENKILQICFDILEKEKTPLEAQKEILALRDVSNRLSRSEQNDEDYYDRIRSGQN